MRYKKLILSISVLSIFAFLMVFGLKHNPNFNPSQLVGQKAPNFISQLSDGQNFEFKNLLAKHNWVIINFWSSGCYVCREEAHELQNFYQTVTLQSTNNPQFVSINIEDDAKIIHEWQKDYSQTFPVVLDPKGLISVNYGVTGTPETFFIDSQNFVRYRVAGTVNKNGILNFIQWFEKHPGADEKEATQALSSGLL